MQTTNTVLMIEPVAFGYNAQTAENNYFQVNSENTDTQSKALQEFKNFVEKLRSKGITVISIQDTLEPHTPDSIFPNNWVSFGADGRVTLYPMYAPNRRDERRMDILENLKNQGFKINEVVDLTSSEKDNVFLEGTGSIIFDHDNKLAYGSVSLRLNEKLFREFCEKFGYTPIVFHSYQTAGTERLPIYHTNVMMCVADRFVVICLDCIDDLDERQNVIDTIKKSGKEIIEISEEQMQNFAGNMLQVHNDEGKKFLVMSQSAYQSLSPNQIESIEKYSEIIYSDLSTIETNGGGSARCMLAEVFLPK
ncbi:citrulline utilization hydrolase CtlX [Riemerella anatipestifer]|uniref:citrulline utilization hydrolase CtlX n=1 Tax=Riemerella anatipestifer TaxID=34085 RepID=UPI00129D6B37|nr:arginine deiminase-related protein [Riemerella anatipestifer]MBT0551646.1 amidinotransferase [Riemerella anatipestifer]MBT0553911.1 amidinotransferase [Riemerella anatipestifer]MCE3024399.1 arginine deiminase-related protein [Riemerella anatipestifer]MCU7542841.1 arginine deiminase-related protein [Riemerella anatipestifer]MCU7559962.1 arginine deiminase-related protein [Riemerella anatipestifer]